MRDLPPVCAAHFVRLQIHLFVKHVLKAWHFSPLEPTTPLLACQLVESASNTPDAGLFGHRRNKEPI